MFCSLVLIVTCILVLDWLWITFAWSEGRKVVGRAEAKQIRLQLLVGWGRVCQAFVLEVESGSAARI